MRRFETPTIILRHPKDLRRFETPTIILSYPDDIRSYRLIATLKQNDIEIEKEIGTNDTSLQNGKTVITFSLTQEETGRFVANRTVSVMVNIITPEGKRIATNPKDLFVVKDNYKDEVI